MIRDVTDLVVWQRGMTLAVETYALAAKLAQAREFDLARQMRRAAVSVPSNVAEGYARRAPTDYKRFLAIANGSVRELETQVLLAVRLELLRSDEAAPVLRSCADLGKLLTALRRSLSSLSR